MTVHNRDSIPILRHVLVNVTFHKLGREGGGGGGSNIPLFFFFFYSGLDQTCSQAQNDECVICCNFMCVK